MLYADADGFWKPPNVYDALGAAGFAVGLASIWLSWYLAKRDIEKRLREAADRAAGAARAEVRRIAASLLRTGVTDAVRSLELAREACNGRRWGRAIDLCQLGREQIERTLMQPMADASLADVRTASVLIRDGVEGLRPLTTGKGDAPDEVARGMDAAILALHRVHGRLGNIPLEA